MSAAMSWSRVLADMPLIAILRGVQRHEAVAIAEALQVAGFLCVEVPLNAPQAHQSIEAIRSQFDGRLVVGAGTVLSIADVSAAHAAGAQFIVSPNTDAAVISATRERQIVSIPGSFTPTEAFAAIEAGADALKLFPAENSSPAALRALRAVIPRTIPVLPVGSITPSNLATWVVAGAAGVGIGSALYGAGSTAAQVRERAATFVDAWRSSRTG